MSEQYRILHVVNEQVDINPVLKVLQTTDYTFEHLSVNTNEKFVEALKNFNPHIALITDENPLFPIKNALKAFKNSNLTVPSIVISDNNSAGYAMELIRNGADDYIQKDDLPQLPAIILSNLLKIKKEYNSKPEPPKFRRLVESGDNALVVFSPDGTTSYISPAAEKILGFSHKDLLKIDITKIVHIEDVQPALDYMALCLENPGISLDTITARVKHKDGTWRWMEASFTNLLHDKDVGGIVNNFKEITAQREAEIALKRNEEKYRAFFINSMDAILLSHPNGNIFGANPAACEMLQRTEEEFCRIGRQGTIDDNSGLAELLEVRKTKAGFIGEMVLKRKDGSRFPAEISSAVSLDENGEEIASTIIRDITGRKKVEEELMLSKKNYEHLFKYNPLPNWIFDLETFKIVAVNRAALKHYGYSKEEFLSFNLYDLRPEEEISKLKANLENLKDANDIIDFGKFTHKKKDGSEITVEVHGYGIKFNGRDCRLVTSIDITEKESVLQELEEKSKKLLLAERLAKFGYWEVGLQDEYFFWSDEVYRIWGRRKEDFQVGPEVFYKTIHPDDLDALLEEQKAAFSGSKDMDFQHRIVLPDGSIKWVHEKGKLVKDSNGQPVRFEGSIQDVTDFKNAMLKLKQSESRQRGILKSQTNYLTRIDLDGNYSYVNEKFDSDFNWIFPDGILVGKCASTSVMEYDQLRVRGIFEKCLANPNVVYQVEMDKLQEDGKVKPTLWDFICLTDAGGNPFEVQGVGIDITDRVEAERSLKESNTRYELVSKATSDAIYDWDIETDYLFWGEAFYALFGYSQREFSLTVDSWTENIHPEERLHIQDSLARTLEGTENHWEAEYRFKNADGKYSFVVEKGFILRDENEKAFRMVGAIQDVTERKRLEELLDEASKFSRIGSFEFDFIKDYLFWSPVTKEIHEVSEDYEPNYETGILYYKQGDSRDRMIRAFKKAVEDNIPYDLELQMVTAKGNECWVRKIGRPTFVDGKCVRINGSFQDITTLKNSELKALKASEEKQVILESIGDAFFTLDNDWVVTYWNQHAEKLLENSKDYILGRNFWDVFPDAVDTEFYRCYQEAVGEQTIVDFEEYFERVNKWFDVTAYPSKGGLSVYFRDVTERKESELQIIELNKNLKVHTEELVAANKGLEQFSYIISHNLRAPVANIIGLGDLIKEDYPSEVKMQFQEELLSNVQRLDTIIRDLNNILHVKVDMSEKKEPVDLNELVETVETGIGQVIQKENVRIITNFSEVTSINSIRTYLHSIFYNLIFNSIKYRRPEVPPVIEITSENREGNVYISFKDNGMGIDLSKKGKQIFGLYKRFHHHVEGKGMGLFMVKTQVELMGGKIQVSSEENKGTEFTIEFKAEKELKQLEDEETEAVYNS
ncbi:PAS domain S-box protein [Salinimicrobium terrae]|uniref:PAS domain S-box protein n=1 Tax=Salinimicrobium terrae TaxID=470866 RepID=UPI0004240F1B|nr:PAS domain S-box protein [Salinimicrobium terrae]